jgi:hypothetical protein
MARALNVVPPEQREDYERDCDRRASGYKEKSKRQW